MNPLIISVVITLLISVIPCNCITCYSCNSMTNKSCLAGNLSSEYKKNCSDFSDGNEYTMCIKIVQVIEHEVNGLVANRREIRNCSWVDKNNNETCYKRSDYGTHMDICYCSTSECNLTSKAEISTIVLYFLFMYYSFYVYVLN